MTKTYYEYVLWWGGSPCLGQEPTGFSMTLLSTHGVDHHCEQSSNSLPRINLWSFQLMICISWLRQKWYHYLIQLIFVFFWLWVLGWKCLMAELKSFSKKRWAAKEKESGVNGSFSPHLPSSAGDFKSLYECHFRDRMVFVPWQEIIYIGWFWFSKDLFPPMGEIESQ